MITHHTKPITSDPDAAAAPYYDAIAQGYDELHGEEQRRKYLALRDILALPLDARVLDVGAGSGLGYAIIPSIGVDPSAGLLANHPHPESVVARAEALPFPDSSFDAALCVSAIHHADVPIALQELVRVSRGPIAVTVLKRIPQADTIVAQLRARFPDLTVTEDLQDWLCVSRNGGRP